MRKLREWHASREESIRDVTRDEFTPEGVPGMDKRAKALLEAAWHLARDERWTDEAAVTELRRLAGRHRDAVEAAEINARHGGSFVDLSVENRAQRLLEAVLTGRPVRQVSPVEQRRMETIDAFDDMDPDEAWADLLRRVPALKALAAEAVRGGLNNDPVPPAGSESRWTEQQLARLRQRVAQLVGPNSGSADVIVGSVYARTFALNRLLWLERWRRQS